MKGNKKEQTKRHINKQNTRLTDRKNKDEVYNVIQQKFVDKKATFKEKIVKVEDMPNTLYDLHSSVQS